MSGMEIFAVLLWALCVLICVMFIWADAGKRNPPKRRRKRKTSNVVLLVLGVSVALFIVAMTVIFCVKGAVKDTLIQYTLGAGGVEALLLAGIKISKVRAGDKPGESEDTYG